MFSQMLCQTLVHLSQISHQLKIQGKIKDLDHHQFREHQCLDQIKTKVHKYNLECLHSKLVTNNHHKDSHKCHPWQILMLQMLEIKAVLLLQEDQCLLHLQWVVNNLLQLKGQVFHHLINNLMLLLQWAEQDQDQWQQIFPHLLKVHQWVEEWEVKLMQDHLLMDKHWPIVSVLFFLYMNNLNRIRNRRQISSKSAT